MRLKCVLVKSDHSQDSSSICNPIPEIFVACIVKSTLWENNRAATSGPKKLQVTLNKENVTPDTALPFTVLTLSYCELMDNSSIFYVPGKLADL
jgi:hypothetical protein